MLEPVKFLFILTGASTYLVTKYIKVGLDDPSRASNSTDGSSLLPFNKTWNETDRSANAIARLAHNGSTFTQHHFLHSSGAGSSQGNGSQNRDGIFHAGRYRNNNHPTTPANSYHIALINFTHNETHRTSQHWPFFNHSGFRPTFEVEINEEDDRDLPKRLLQVDVHNSSHGLGLIVLQISLANDDRSHDQEGVLYEIEGEGVSRVDGKFSINKTSGEIYVLRALDRDRPLGKPQWRLSALARRGGQVLGYADIVVHLRDLNDNVPQFTHSVYYTNLSESSAVGSKVIQVQALDADDPNTSSGSVLYSIEQNQINKLGEVMFGIDADSGLVSTLVCCLDRETRHNYSITVAATDGSHLKSSAIVIITVLDVNDCPPRFTQRQWQVEVDESDGDRPLNSSQLPPVLLRITVQDSDLPQTNHFIYKIVEERYLRQAIHLHEEDYLLTDEQIMSNYSQHFLLTANPDGSASLRILRPVDYEIASQRFIVLKVIVSDTGQFDDRSHIDVCFVCIKVRDTNDNKPQFAQRFVNVTLPENVALGTIITKFHATDLDQNGHSLVLYSLDSETNKKRFFTIDSEGFVRLSRPLDRETTPTHIVKVMASDREEPALTATGTLVVNVEDINDNAPLLINTSLPSVLENSHATKIGEIYAFDKDDYMKGNGPPFTFFLDPNASEEVKLNFRLEVDYKNEGKAVLYSRSVLDRELRKQYVVPVVVRDSGYPPLSSTCMVYVTVGDINDNEMKDGWKEVNVYYIADLDSDQQHLLGNANGQSLHKPIEIGQVNVQDADDWDYVDKEFAWDSNLIVSNFYLDTERGVVYMKRLAKGRHLLQFTVFDRRHQQRAHSTMQVDVKSIPLNAVLNAGSLRIANLDSFEFIRIWDWTNNRRVTSIKERLESNLKQIVEGSETLEIFSIIDHHRYGKHSLDVRFFAKSGGKFLTTVYLNGIVQQKSDLLRDQLELDIVQVGINECMDEEQHACESSSCYTDITIDWTNPSHLIHANFTSFVGVNLQTHVKCSCFYDNLLSHFSHEFICDIDQTLCPAYVDMTDSCHVKEKLSAFTRNYLTSLTSLNFKCVNSDSFTSNSRSFKSNGWIWLDPFPLCSKNFISIQIVTKEPNGIIFYYGPIRNQSSRDFILLELVRGIVRLMFDFGSGVGELTLARGERVNDGKWHQLDVSFDTTSVYLMLDTCAQAGQTRFEGVQLEWDLCQNRTDIPPFAQLLNVNAPLQVGGIAPDTLPNVFGQVRRRDMSGFTGCIRNLVANRHIYDLSQVHHQYNSSLGCQPTNSLCALLHKDCNGNGLCDGNYHHVECVCNRGFYGPDCSQHSAPVMFGPKSFVHLSLVLSEWSAGTVVGETLHFYQHGTNFATGFLTKIDFYFRTRQRQGEIVRLTGQNEQTYCVVEIRNGRITFRFNLNPSGSKSERLLSIDWLVVNDGKWHRVEAYRYAQWALLSLDKGGIGKSVRLEPHAQLDSKHVLFELNPHQIVVGGQIHYLGIGATTISNDYVDSCLSDLKINDIYISLSDLIRPSSADYRASLEPTPTTTTPIAHRPERVSYTSGSTTRRHSPALLTHHQNVHLGCQPTLSACSKLHCPKPFLCIDQWMLAQCRCPDGLTESEDGKSCVENGELCQRNPCLCRRVLGAHLVDNSSLGTSDSVRLSRLSSTLDGTAVNQCDEATPSDYNRQASATNARIFQLEYGVLALVIIALVPLNIPFLVYIIYICCRNRKASIAGLQSASESGDKSSDRGATQTTPFNEDIRESVICYRDEGGGEGDMRAYDMVPLRIQIANQSALVPCNAGSYEPLTSSVSTKQHHQSNNFDTWQELTVV